MKLTITFLCLFFYVKTYSQTNIFPANGNVGIGTASPDTKLHVNGTIKSNLLSLVEGSTIMGFFGKGMSITSGWNQTPNILSLTYMGRDFAIGGWSKSNATWKGAAFYINSDNGNIGIGTTNPDAKLAVNGLIHTQEVKVDMNGWSDFVFAKDYVLPTLAETEKHIKENGHLQGIPSAKEVKANGIDLGDMNAKLLQKIEELTLHLIQKEKDIEAQNIRIEKLEKIFLKRRR